METGIYRCVQCLGVLDSNRYCQRCNIFYLKECLSTHGCAGYSPGTIILKVAICPGCGAESFARDEAIGRHVLANYDGSFVGLVSDEDGKWLRREGR